MLRDLLRCRRASVALTFTLTAIPLIGMVGLGTEVGMWYATKRHAQNAADAAAISGAMRLACSLGAVSCTDTETIAYRGKEFAAQNSFCTTGDTTTYPGSTCGSLPPGTTQTVQIDVGAYANGAFTPSPGDAGNAVRATVLQIQPYLLASLFLSGNATIAAQAVALVKNPRMACALALTTLTIGGSPQWGGGNCALVSDGNVKMNSSPQFPAGVGWSVYGTSGCSSSSNCAAVGPNASYDWYAQPTTNPLAALDSYNTCSSFNVSCTGSLASLASTGTSSNQCQNGIYGYDSTTGTGTCTFSPTPLAGSAYGGLKVTGGNVVLASGTYIFYNANVSISGGTVTGTDVNIVLLGNSSLSINGGATVQLTADMNNSTYPELDGVLIDDQATSSSSNSVTVNGSSSSYYGGEIYVPNNALTWEGNAASGNGCTEIIGNTITIQGTTNFDVSGCPAGTIPETQAVALVQ